MRIRPGPDDKVETVSVSHLIVARKALSETTAAAFFRQLFAVRQAIARQVPGAAHIAKPDTEKDAELPVHRERRPSSTAPNVPSSTGTAITSGLRSCFSPGSVRLAPGCVTI